jgi:hypothetical protein
MPRRFRKPVVLLLFSRRKAALWLALLVAGASVSTALATVATPRPPSGGTGLAGRVIGLDPGHGAIDSGATHPDSPLPEKAILVTFDDGYRSMYVHAWPVLRMFRIPAVVNVVGSWIEAKDTIEYDDRPQPRSAIIEWKALREMVGDADLEIPDALPPRYRYHPERCPQCGETNYTGGTSLCGGADGFRVWVVRTYRCRCGCTYRATTTSCRTRTIRHDLLCGPRIEDGYGPAETAITVVTDGGA